MTNLTTKNKIITISWDTCQFSGKCQGCYLEHLKLNSPSNEYKTILSVLNAIDITPRSNIIYNISNHTDLYKMLIIQKEMKQLHLNKCQTSIVIHSSQIKSSKAFLLNNENIIDKSPNIDLTLSINENTIKHPEWEKENNIEDFLNIKSESNNFNLSIELSLTDMMIDSMLSKKHVYTSIMSKIATSNCPIILNYIPFIDSNRKKAFVKLNKIMNIYKIPFTNYQISNCLTSLIYSNVKPCKIYEVIDILKIYNFYDRPQNRIIINKGCPFPVKACENFSHRQIEQLT